MDKRQETETETYSEWRSNRTVLLKIVMNFALVPFLLRVIFYYVICEKRGCEK